MSEIVLQQLQVGKEVVATRGTAVAPTAKLMKIEECSITPIREVLQPEERRGSLAPAYNSAMLKTTGQGTVKGLVTYEDLPYWLDSLLGEATPSGTASPYTYSYTAPLTAAPTPRIMTMVYGDGTRAWALTGAIVDKLTLSQKYGDVMRFEAELLGYNVAADSLEALSDRTVEEVEPGQIVLKIDSWGGTMGNTAVSAVLFSFELALMNNLANKFHLGSLTPGGYRVARLGAELKLYLEVDAVTAAYLTSMIGTSPLQQQVQITATSGTKVITLQFAGTVLESPEIYADEDGIVALEYTLSGEYHSTFANYFKASVANAVASLP